MSKVEKDNFRYTGIDVETYEDRIEIKMEDYIDSLDEIKEIRAADNDETLTRVEMKVHRKMTGKLSWLANSTCPDLSYNVWQCPKIIKLQG